VFSDDILNIILKYTNEEIERKPVTSYNYVRHA